MNPTPTGGSAVPAPDGDAPDGESSAVPGPRSGVHPLPHRLGTRDRNAGRGPDRRRSGAPDEATLHRLLIGLREI